MTTIKKIAQTLNLSPSTVSLALRGAPQVNYKTRLLVEEEAKRQSYHPNLYARSLQSGSSQLIGCLVAKKITSSFFAEVLEGIGETAAQAGLATLVSWCLNTQSLPMHVARLREHQVRSVIIIGNSPELVDIAHNLKRDRVNVIFCTSGKHKDFPFVVTDDTLGGRMAADYLLECGHRNILVMFSNNANYEGRAESCFNTLMAAGCRVSRVDNTDDLMDAWHKTQATAVAALSDTLALQIIHILRSRGLKVPEDVSVIGYDNLSISAMGEFRLTTIGQQSNKLGEVAVDYLLKCRRASGYDKTDIQTQILLQPELVERNSVRRI